jgi:hypothetical protein
MKTRTNFKDDGGDLTMTKENPTVHSTWLTLRQPDNFKRFFDGLTEYLKEHMVTQKIGGS